MERKFFKSTQIFIVAAAILLTLFTTILCIGFLMRYEVSNDVSSLRSVSYWNDKLSKEQQIWFNDGIAELRRALNLRLNRRRAQNILVFVVTGVDAEVLASARWRGEDMRHFSGMSWDSFTHLGQFKHSCNNKQHCDPICVSSAIFSGVKSTVEKVPVENCSASLKKSHRIKSIIRLAQETGRRTGFITTNRVTAPPSSALYTDFANPLSECDLHGDTPQENRDIGSELIKSQTGSNINVIMGGGRQILVGNASGNKIDPMDDMAWNSSVERNLIDDWQQQKHAGGNRFAVLQNREDFGQLNGSNVDYVLGIFANVNLKQDRHKEPLLKEMVSKALTVLIRPEGYLLVVNAVAESHSINQQKQTLLNLNAAVEEALQIIRDDLDKTLVAVLFNNAACRDTRDPSKVKMVTPFYRNGSPNGNDDLAETASENIRADSVLYAQGPMAFLLQGLHDDTFLAHALTYAMQTMSGREGTASP